MIILLWCMQSLKTFALAVRCRSPSRGNANAQRYMTEGIQYVPAADAICHHIAIITLSSFVASVCPSDRACSSMTSCVSFSHSEGSDLIQGMATSIPFVRREMRFWHRIGFESLAREAQSSTAPRAFFDCSFTSMYSSRKYMHNLCCI